MHVPGLPIDVYSMHAQLTYIHTTHSKSVLQLHCWSKQSLSSLLLPISTPPCSKLEFCGRTRGHTPVLLHVYKRRTKIINLMYRDDVHMWIFLKVGISSQMLMPTYNSTGSTLYCKQVAP